MGEPAKPSESSSLGRDSHQRPGTPRVFGRTWGRICSGRSGGGTGLAKGF